MSSLKKAKSNSSILIIGSGLAGYTLVRELRKLDTEIAITMISSDDGAYYSKPQLSNAFTHHKTPEQLALFSAEKAQTQFNIQLINNTRVTAILPEEKRCETEGASFSYEKLVLATGAKPSKLPGLENAYQVNNLMDYAQFRKAIEGKKKVTIVGAGLVGCEFANDLLNGGFEVTVIAPEQYPLARLIPEAAGLQMKKMFADKGVNWILGKNVIEGEALPGEIILSAVGLKSDISLAQTANIKINRGFIVDEYLETSQADIYALGDCAEIQEKVMLYVAPLSISARTLAKTLCNQPTKVAFPAMPIYVKTPLYPVVSLIPDQKINAQSQNESSSDGVKTLYYDSESRICGFVLTSKYTVQTTTLLTEINKP